MENNERRREPCALSSALGRVQQALVIRGGADMLDRTGASKATSLAWISPAAGPGALVSPNAGNSLDCPTQGRHRCGGVATEKKFVSPLAMLAVHPNISKLMSAARSHSARLQQAPAVHVMLSRDQLKDGLHPPRLTASERPVKEISNLVGLAAGLTVAAWTTLGVQLVDRFHHNRPVARHQLESDTPRWAWLRQAVSNQSGQSQHQQSKQGLANSRQTAALLDKGMKLEADLDILAARKCYQEALKVEPENVEVITRLSKTWTDMSYSPGYPAEDIPSANRRALVLAKQAIQLDPEDALGHIAACVSMGRLAMCSENRQKVRLAFEAQEEAKLAMSCDPQSDLAHHLQGRWHYEMAGVNCVIRTLVRMMYGTALQAGSHKDAMVCYKRAVELRPERLIHHVELGRCMLKMGMLQEAQSELETGLLLGCEDINSHLTRKDAERLLVEVKTQLALRGGGNVTVNAS